MKAAAVYPQGHRLGVIDMDSPQAPSPTGLTMRVLEVGVCGTDREICSFEYGFAPAGSDYLVLGHECLAEITGVGPEVTGFRLGDLAVPMVRHPCHHLECSPCVAHRQDFCETGDYTERGIKEQNGFMTEVITEEARYVHALPARLRNVGVLVEPLTIAEKGIEQVVQIQGRVPCGYQHTALVFGAGPVGLLGALGLIANGFKTWVYSREDDNSEQANITRGMGAEYISAKDAAPGELATRLGDLDVIYEAAGAPPPTWSLLESLGMNGVYIFTGVPGADAHFQFDVSQMLRQMVLKNQVLLGTVNAGASSFQKAIRDLDAIHQKCPAAVESMITGRFALADFATPVGKPGGIKNIVMVG